MDQIQGVTSLLDAGVPAAARKVGKEAVEVVTAALAESDERLVEEAANLVFHLYVLLAARDLDVAQVEDELELERPEGRLFLHVLGGPEPAPKARGDRS